MVHNVIGMDTFIVEVENFQLTQGEFLIRMLIALGIGAIVGLEREHAAMKEHIRGFAGIRTFIFVVMLGFIGGLSYFLLSPLIYLGILVSVAILTGISYFVTASKGDIGATTEFSLLVSFFLGTLTFLGFLEMSLMIMVLIVVLLSLKLRLRSIVGKITMEEMYDFIRFVVIALLIFPFLPDEPYGPYHVLNPREIGWVVILTSGLGFLGYILMKFLGAKKGILLSGIIGGLISSTAVTWIFAGKSKENGALSKEFATAILAASLIMVVRVLVWTFIFNKALFDELFWPVSFVFVIGMAITVYFYYQTRGNKIDDTQIRQNKPLDLRGAVVFGIIYIVILLVVSYANDYLGQAGLLISSMIAGFSDIDAITITVSKLAGNGFSYSIAANAVILATLSNTLVKLGIGLWAGSAALRRELLIGYGVVFIALLGVIAYLNVW